MKILDIQEHDRPRERLHASGVTSLSDTELIAILLGSGHKEKSALDLAAHMLKKFTFYGLSQATPRELLTITGIGDAKSAQLCAAFELHKRLQRPRKKSIQNPKDVFLYARPLIGHLQQEHFLVIFLDVRKKILGHEIVSKGLVDATLVHPREVFRGAIKANAKAVIIAHNHPSGEVDCSQEDIDVTKKLSKAGAIVGIQLLDHLVVTQEDYQCVV